MSSGQRSRCKPGNRDGNERPIIETLEAHGYVVTQINGKGVPDLLVSKWGRMWLIEVKQPKGVYKPAQITFRERWTGPPIFCLRSVEEARTFAVDGGRVDGPAAVPPSKPTNEHAKVSNLHPCTKEATT